MMDALLKIARKAGEFFETSRMTDVTHKEGHGNYVTNIDCQVQAYLEEQLPRLLPGSRFIGEEKENQALTDAPTWIVDPLDGTMNMIHDYRMSAVSIALCENRKPVAGVIWQPFSREMFCAEAGKGAWLNGEAIHVSERAFPEALAAVGTAPYYEELEPATLKMAGAFLRACSDFRRSGSAALDLAYLACGRHEIYCELRIKPWDYAAGSLLVQEAGGLICMPLNGGPMDYSLSTAVLAATPECMPEALKIVSAFPPQA